MMILKKDDLRIVWFLLFSLVLCSNYVLYHTSFGISLLPANTKGVVIGSLIDLTIVAPLLFLVWKRKVSWKSYILLMASGIITARFLIPMEYLAPFQAITWVGFLIEGGLLLFELILLVSLFIYLPKMISSVKQSPLPFVFSFSNAADSHVKKHPIIHVLCSEMLMFYYAFASWKKKPLPQEMTFTLHHQSSFIAFQVMLIHAIIIETIGIHWWLHEKSLMLSIVLLLLNIYSIIFFIGDIQAVRLNPLKVDHDRMYVSFGLMKRMEIRWDEIAEIIEDREKLEGKLSKDTIIFMAQDFKKVYPNVRLTFKHPIEATLIMGLKRKYNKVAIKVDDSERFKAILKDKVNEVMA